MGRRMNRADRFNGNSITESARVMERRSNASCGIAFMAKASAPGRAKTRLVPPLTFDEAADLNTAFLQDVAENLLLASHRTSEPVAIGGYAAYGPPGSEGFFRTIMPESIGLLGAWLPNFGDCLFHTIRELLQRGHDSAVVLNADSPTLPTAFLVETAEALARPGDRAVLGPSTDGGYYLLGLKAAHRRMFEDIDWSTERVAEQTLERAREIDLEIQLLPAWYDVDDLEDLRRLYGEVCGPDKDHRRRDGVMPHRARQTAALMQKLARDRDFLRSSVRILQAEEMRA
jgi:rSAM/selenodomain-associated transferase 1